ncbi:von Willebrand factor A domain-containing protein 3B [Elysia marginata]|uniref:von Willebrand factor A domain-containing protein 3B n=1 Tax=Elysia marginata TaxID=1093978 RepID=A0AAV4HDN2_9GAST|nr:von Willebrand factor A domain-containing protein 3B [Elysia marginata]
MSEESNPVNGDETEEVPRMEPSAPPQEEEAATATTEPPVTSTASVESQSCEPALPDVQESSLDEMEPQPPTMFGLVPEKCVTFCIDTSGSMFKSLSVVKEHLMETLHSLSRRRDEKAMFNLIEFNSQVRNTHKCSNEIFLLGIVILLKNLVFKPKKKC